MGAEGSPAASISQAENEESQTHTNDHIGPASKWQRQMGGRKKGTMKGKGKQRKQKKKTLGNIFSHDM